ncbi:MAG: ABC transporter permease, partial [Myxococcales bacterium]|nr:ABC transporter permease [Myxococcales bacterium]
MSSSISLWRVALRNVTRNKARFSMTLLAVCISVLIFMTLDTAKRSWDSAKEVSRQDRLVTRHKVTFVLSLPKRYVSRLTEAKGGDGAPLVQRVTYAVWFGGREPNHEHEFFQSVAVDAESYFDVYEEVELSPEALSDFRQNLDAAIIGEGLARKLGLKVGDSVSLQSPIYPSADGNPWSFRVAGVYGSRSRAVDTQSFVFRYERLNEALPARDRDQVGWLVSRTPPGADPQATARAVDSLFADSDVQTLTQDERAFVSGFLGMVSTVLDVVTVLSYAILVIVLLVLANAMGLSVRERIREYASLRALGFSPGDVLRLILLEAIYLSLIGVSVGIAV